MSLFLGIGYIAKTHKIYSVRTEKCVHFVKRPCSGFLVHLELWEDFRYEQRCYQKEKKNPHIFI